MEEEKEEDEEASSDEDEPAAAVVEDAGAPTPAKKGRGRPRKQLSPADAGNGSSVCGSSVCGGCQPAQSKRTARGRAARGSGVEEDSSPWDAVECQRCGSTDREHKMILCDECDGGYHYDTCAYPRLYALPRGNWYCYECQKRRKQAQRLEALEQGPAPLGVAQSVLGAAKSGRERKATARFRPRLGV